MSSYLFSECRYILTEVNDNTYYITELNSDGLLTRQNNNTVHLIKTPKNIGQESEFVLVPV